MIRKLRIKFVCINMLIVTVLLIAMMGLVLRFNRESAQIMGLQRIRRVTTTQQDPAPPGRITDGAPGAFFTLELNPEGTLIARGSDAFDLSDKTYLRQLLLEAQTSGEENGILEDYGLRFHRRESPRGVSYIFEDITVERNMQRNLRKICMVVGILSFMAFLGVSILLSRWAIRPVETAWQQQRQFVADASHQLKTPLAVIMANAEVLANQSQDGESQRFAGHILTMSYQMRTLVEQLLNMARLDSEKIRLEALDLSELTQDAVLSMQLLYEEKGRQLTSAIAEGVMIRGSESHLYQLLDVLLDNALKYSQGEDPVHVELKNQGMLCTLTVTSPGKPLTSRECRDIFKRFYRLDQARAIDDGHGLGLSIAQGIVHAHRGRIQAYPQGSGNCFSVQLPCIRPGSKPAENL